MLSFFAVAGYLHAQTNPYLKDVTKEDSAKLSYIKRKVGLYQDSMQLIIKQQRFDTAYFYSDAAFDYYFNKTFTKLNFDGVNFNIGNAASLKFEDGETKLNLNASFKSKTTLFTVGTALNITDKNGVIFSGNKPTAGTEFSINVSQLLPSKKIAFSETVKDMMPYLRTNTLDSIVNLYVFQRPAQYDEAKDSLKKVETKLDAAFKKIDSLQLQIADFKNVYPGLATVEKANGDLKKSKEEYIALNTERQKIIAVIKQLQSTNSRVVEADRIINSAKAADMRTMLDAGGIVATRLQWLSAGILYKRYSYKTYDSDKAFDIRVGEKNFDYWKLNLGYNFYWGRSQQDLERDKNKGGSFITSHFISIFYTPATTNTYDELDEENINIIKESSRNDTIYQIVTSSKNRNIAGVEYKKMWKHSFGIQWAPAFGKKQFLGANIIYSNDFAKGLQPVFNARAGMLFHFKSLDDEKTKVNFEVYLSFKDMADAKNKGGSVWHRKEIGVTATVPFSKVFFN